MLYMQLARHREEIEDEVERLGDLSLRAAVRLISTPKSDNESDAATGAITRAPVVDPVAISSAWSDEVWGAVLLALGVDRLLKVCPPDLRSQLAARAAEPEIRKPKSAHPGAKLKNSKRDHLRVIEGTPAEETKLH
jgi:hypothetical protein